MQKNKPIIIFDIDGTAVDSPKQNLPSKRLVNAVRDLQETHLLCAATGRPWSYARPVLHELGLTEPCIISSGAQICNPRTGGIIWQSNLDNKASQEVARILNNHPGLREYPKCRVLLDDYDLGSHFSGGLKAGSLEIGGSAYCIHIVFVPDNVAIDVQARLSLVDNVTCTLAVAQAPGLKDLHITSSDATKEHAVGRLLELAGLEKYAAIGVGDGHNDLHLFNAVNHKVAMGNAVDELKRVAHEVLGSVEEDGLALFFERQLAGPPLASYVAQS
jgi:5-amino-6-(5-phospho-D-ribitylamino)uracil phosphatase